MEWFEEQFWTVSDVSKNRVVSARQGELAWTQRTTSQISRNSRYAENSSNQTQKVKNAGAFLWTRRSCVHVVNCLSERRRDREGHANEGCPSAVHSLSVLCLRKVVYCAENLPVQITAFFLCVCVFLVIRLFQYRRGCFCLKSCTCNLRHLWQEKDNLWDAFARCC